MWDNMISVLRTPTAVLSEKLWITAVIQYMMAITFEMPCLDKISDYPTEET
jgi:uncharacterized membrane protein AbrB (regulator of aidB expression)